MHKLISRGAKFLSFSFPKTHFIPRIKFSSQIDSHLQGADQLTISKSLYSEEEYRKIEEIQQMPYQVLLEEVKKYSNRPKTRAKNNLIQFLIAQVPKKGVINENNSFTQELELDENQIITHHRHDYAHNHNEESYAADTEEAIKILRENSLFNDLKFEIGLFSHRLTPPIAQKTLPYLENYPEKQLLDHINSLSNVDLKREMEQLIHRSPLYSKIPLVKVKKLAKDDLSSSFKDMLFVHRDYAHLHRNFLKHILADPKGKLYTTLDCLEALRSLERSTNLARWHTYLQTLSPNALIRFWSVIFESIDSKSILLPF